MFLLCLSLCLKCFCGEVVTCGAFAPDIYNRRVALRLPKLRARLLHDARMVTSWIYEIIKRICQETGEHT
jgi:hypothetical protein